MITKYLKICQSKICILLCLFFYSSACPAASPYTHLYLAEHWCAEEGVPEEHIDEVLRGSTFPDIRYLAHVPRETTHHAELSYEEIFEGESWFERGCLHHCWVDIEREKIAQASNIYEVIAPYAHGHCTTLMKLVEDEMVCERIEKGRYVEVFSGPLSNEEKATEFSREVLEAWNQRLKIYLSVKPSHLLQMHAVLNKPSFGISSVIMAEWAEIIPQLIENKIINYYFEEMIDELKKCY